MRRALVLLVLVTACDEEVAPAPPELLPPLAPSDPAAPGPYRVGVTAMAIDDGRGLGRRLPVEIWYPATPAAGSSATRYPLLLGELVIAELDSPLGAVREAPLDYRGAPHPVVVFTHGYGGTRVQSVYLTEYLASHGFVVAAPDHSGNTFAEVVTETSLPAVDLARLRPGDVGSTLDALLERSAGWPDDPLAFAADGGRVGVAGHSFGGFTALRVAGASIDIDAATQACADNPGELLCEGWPGEEPLPSSQRDPRFIAALPQAPGGTIAFQLGGGTSDVEVPTMVQAGTADATTPLETEAEPIYADLPSPAYLLTVEGAGHFTFSDICTLLGVLDIDVAQFDDGCSPDHIAPAEAHPVLQRSATAFARYHVAGDESAADELSNPALPAFASLASK
jgi:predicted dienelactone hydrolase